MFPRSEEMGKEYDKINNYDIRLVIDEYKADIERKEQFAPTISRENKHI